MRYLISLLFVLIGLRPAICQTLTQTVRGRVVDAETHTTLPGAHVVLQPTTPVLGAITNRDGTFTITHVPVGRYQVKASFLGYQTSIIPGVLVGSGKEVNLVIELHETVYKGTEVTVTAKNEKGKPENQMASVSALSFSVEETRRFAGSADDPLRAASAYPGVAANADVNSNGVVIRGNSPKGLLWLLDGVPIPNPNHFRYVGRSAGGITIFSSQVLANSDFYTSAFPAEYGNALSGVFDMHFRTGNPYKREYTAQLGIQGIEFAAEGPFTGRSESSYLFNYRYSVLGFLQLIDPSMKNRVPSYQDLSFKINVPTHKVGVFSLFGIGGIDRSGARAERDSTQWTSNDDRSETRMANDMGAVGLTNKLVFGRNTYLKTTVAQSGYFTRYHNGYIGSNYDLYPTDNVKYGSYQTMFVSKLTHRFSKQITWDAGGSVTNHSYNADIWSRNIFSGDYEHLINDRGALQSFQSYIDSKWQIGQHWSIVAGAHFQYLFLNHSNVIGPRGSVSYEIDPKTSIRLGYGLESQQEGTSVYLARTTTGLRQNRNLGLSKSHQFVLSYKQHLNKDLILQIEPYLQLLYDIPVVPGSYYSMLNNPGGYFNEPLVNKGKGRNAGVDVMLEHFMSSNYYYMISASIFRSRYKGGDGVWRNTRYDSRFVGNLLGGKEWQLGNRLLGVNLKTSLTGGERYVPIDLSASRKQNREVLDEQRAYIPQLSWFFYLDLTVTLRTNHHHYSGIWAIQIKNLLNNKPIIGYDYNRFSGGIDTIRPLGIIPFLSYKIEF